jgi:2-polyprenyl-3-methyl-5-hydroxy-6-metoxy-1,4-benzoquinol methylase
MTRNITPKEFWEDKIVGWEKGRYKKQDRGGFLERLANHSSSSLRFRIQESKLLLQPFVANKFIVEIGCGTGLLAPEFISMGAKRYLGYDIAENAIEQASKRFSTKDITFEVADVNELPLLEADIVFSLGLLDWLNDDELKHLFMVSGQSNYFHAIAEKRQSLAQMIHRLYVFISYGHRTGAYIPRYYQTKKMEEMIQVHNTSKLHVYRDKRLSFGAFVSSLPIND